MNSVLALFPENPVLAACLAALIAVGIGYLLGCSNMAYYLSRARGVDLRAGGSGNLGASNAMALLGWKAAILVGLHDILKAVAAVLIARALFPQVPALAAAAGSASVFGHIFPFWLRFRGGKGFAPFIGIAVALNWKFGLALMAAVAVITLLSDYIVFGTFTSILVTPIFFGVLHRDLPTALIIAAASLLILWKHRENIVRLRNGTEIGLRRANRGDERIDRKERKK